MHQLRSELEQQPQTLRKCIEFYTRLEGLHLLEGLPEGAPPLLTGMGASYHAAWIGALHLNQQGIRAQSLEATDLVYHASALLHPDQPLIYISQSGGSAEIYPILEQLGEARLVAITNHPESTLAQAAHLHLPLQAGDEHLVASKTYLNSLVLVWLIAGRLAVRRLSARSEGSDVTLWAAQQADLLDQVADRCEQLVQDQKTPVDCWLDALQGVEKLVFVGHGPHAATARQAAMLVSEWTKQPAMAFSAGGLRHGFIEALGPGIGAVLFAPAGASQASMLALAGELQGYGVRVLIISNGVANQPGETVPPSPMVDEYLSPILDIVPVQHYVEHTARQMGLAPVFRHIQKVITRL